MWYVALYIVWSIFLPFHQYSNMDLVKYEMDEEYHKQVKKKYLTYDIIGTIIIFTLSAIEIKT